MYPTDHDSIRRFPVQLTRLLRVLVPILILSGALPAGVASEEQKDPLIQRMISVVLTNNPVFKSQETLVVQSGKLRIPNPWFSLNALNFSVGSNTWDLKNKTFDFSPWVEVGTSLSLYDPAKALSGYSIRKEQESTRQAWLEGRNKLVSELISRVGEIAKLGNRRSSMTELLQFLEDQSGSIAERIIMSTAEPEKLWTLRERIMELEIEIRDVENQLETLKLETAMNLAGDAWPELESLLDQIGANP